MFRLFGILLVGIMFGIAGINSAWADTINCIRGSNSSFGYKRTAFEVWFPKELHLSIYNWSEIPFQKSIKKGQLDLYGTLYQLLPNGKMKASKDLPQYDRYKYDVDFTNANYNTLQVFDVWYKCDKTAVELATNIEAPSTQITSSTTTLSITPSSAELLSVKRKSEELEQQLAALKAEQEQQQQNISNDTQIPSSTITSVNTKGKQGVISGRVSDNVGVAEVTVAGQQANPIKTEEYTAPTLGSSSSALTVVTTPSKSSFAISASSTKWRDAKTPQDAQLFANDIQASIVMFMAIADVIKKQPPSLKDRVLGVVDNEIARLRAEKEMLQQQLSSRFSTPIRPSNANLTVSAFRAADTFPKIPFYVPGTNEIGEMLIIPRVTDDGFLKYKFDFLDPTATYDRVRDTISIPHDSVDAVITGLQKVDEWTNVAQENNINRRVEKSAACVPEGKCENKKQGVSSTEVMFQIYEDGSTAGRIQRNKGKYSVGYNMSVESSILLSAYLTYMRDVGAKEFNIGVMSDEEVKNLFE